MSKRAILYARVSTDEQADKGYSLPSQFDAMRRYVAQQGFDVVGEFQDDYSGATPIEHRPEGRKAYTMLQSGAADAIVAYTIDRYVRPPEDGDEWEMPILIRGLAKLGKEIHTVRRGKLNTNFADLLIALLDARKAGEERRDIRERSMRGKRAKVKSGKVIGMRPPYGYRHIRDEHGKAITLEIDETTARVVRLIYQWYVEGDEHGKRLSAQAISKRLSEMGVTTPGEMGRGYKRKRKAGMWSSQTILAILRNEVYAGLWRYGMLIGSTKQRRPLEETVTANVPAIVDRPLWERAQAQRAYNQAMALRNCKRDYLLRGMIRCTCGFAMCGNSNKPHRIYSCITRRHFHKGIEENPCRVPSVRADAIEADGWGEIEELFSDLDRFWDELKAAQQEELDGQEPQRDELQAVEGLLQDAEGEAAKIAAALPDAQKGGAVYRILQDKEKETNAHIAELARRREQLMTKLGAQRLTDDAIATIMQYARDARAGLENADFHAKRRILESLDVRVTITPGQYHIKCLLGEKDGQISQMKRGNIRIVPSAS